MAKKKKKDTVAEEGPPAVNDAYTGMLGISLVALLVGCALLALDYFQYDPKAAPTPAKFAPAAPGQAAPAPPEPAPAPPPPKKDL